MQVSIPYQEAAVPLLVQEPLSAAQRSEAWIPVPVGQAPFTLTPSTEAVTLTW